MQSLRTHHALNRLPHCIIRIQRQNGEIVRDSKRPIGLFSDLKSGDLKERFLAVSNQSYNVGRPMVMEYWRSIPREERGDVHIGVVLKKDAKIVCIDLDRGFDKALINEFVQRAGGWGRFFCETSVSGRGLHLWAFDVSLSGRGVRADGIEVYDNARMIITPGHEAYDPALTFEESLDADPIGMGEDEVNGPAETAQVQGAVLWLEQQLRARQKIADTGDAEAFTIARSPEASNEAWAAIEAAQRRFGRKFSSLFEGDISGYPSHSEADMAMFRMLATVCGDNNAVALAFLETELASREKAQREDYVTMSIAKIRATEGHSSQHHAAAVERAEALTEFIAQSPIVPPVEQSDGPYTYRAREVETIDEETGEITTAPGRVVTIQPPKRVPGETPEEYQARLDAVMEEAVWADNIGENDEYGGLDMTMFWDEEVEAAPKDLLVKLSKRDPLPNPRMTLPLGQFLAIVRENDSDPFDELQGFLNDNIDVELWSEPILIDEPEPEPLLPQSTFEPIDVRNPGPHGKAPGLIGEVAQHYADRSTRGVYDYSIAAMIAATSGLAGRNWLTGMNENGLSNYFAIIGASGSGKSVVSNVIKGFEKHRAGTTIFKRGVTVSRPTSFPAFVNIINESPSLCLNLPEFSSEARKIAKKGDKGLSQMTSGVMDFLKTSFDSGIDSVVPQLDYSNKDNNKEPPKAPMVAFITECDHNVLDDLFRSDLTSDGTLARFTFVVNTEIDRNHKRIKDDTMPPAYAARIRELWAMHDIACRKSSPEFTAVTVTEEAMAMYDDCVRQYEMQLGDSMPAKVQDMLNRIYMRIDRIAAAIAVFNDPQGPIVDEATMAWAIRFASNHFNKIRENIVNSCIDIEWRQYQNVTNIIRDCMAGIDIDLPDRMVKQIKENALSASVFDAITITDTTFTDSGRGAQKDVRRIMQKYIDDGVLLRLREAGRILYKFIEKPEVPWPKWVTRFCPDMDQDKRIARKVGAA